MEGVRPWLRRGGLILPLLTAGCASGILPGSEAADPSCLLLCAVTRMIAGETAPRTVQAVVATTPPQPMARAARPQPRSVAKASRPALAQARPRPAPRKPVTQVSVVPQALPQVASPAPAAEVPTVPAPVTALPAPAAAPARAFTQAIPGSVGIMTPRLQGE